MTVRFQPMPRAGLAARSLVLALPVMLTGAPAAQSQPAAPVSVQAPAVADAEPSGFRSAFEGYRSLTDEKIFDWKLANDEVGRIGGWRAYAREASTPDSARRDGDRASPAQKPERDNPSPGPAGNRRGAPEPVQPANIKP